MSITAEVHYHVHKDAPQAFEFEAGGIAGKLISPELDTREVCVRDLRDAKDQPSFKSDGIAFLKAPTDLSDFTPEGSWQARYDAELDELLKANIGAQEVIVFDHTVRIDDANALRRPARNVHNDYNREGAEQRLIDIVGAEQAREFHAAGFGFVNVWRPIEHVITSSPLGFIHPASMKAEDWMDIDLIYPDRRGHILGVAANADHDWFYTSDMTPEEVVIFNIYDSKGRPHLAHSALDLPTDGHSRHPRKSIESRTLVRFS